MIKMKRYTTIALALATAVAAGCRDNPVSNPIDAPTVDALNGALTPTSLLQLVIGALAQDRTTWNDVPSAIEAGIFARDVYRIDASEPRYVTETLGGNPDPGSFAGGRGFAGYYTALRAENNLLKALASAGTSQFTQAQIDATSGFIRTMKAYEYWRVIEMRDTVGATIQTDDANAITPIRCKEPVLAYALALLDSANADFAAAGVATTLPVKLPTGFSAFGRDYNKVSNLIRFNRGLKGKIEFYTGLNRKGYTPALFPTAIADLTTALGAGPGAVPASQFKTGVWYNFVAGGSENQPNIIADSKIGLNPLVADSVQAGDTRGAKIVARPTLAGNGLSTSITYVGAQFTSGNQNAPMPILRDEELVLLRAQAYIENNDLPDAQLDINSVRTNYGLLPVILTSKTQAIDAVLYEKRFSLFFEGAQRLVDLREYGRLNNTYLRKELPNDPFNAALPLPRAELDARGLIVNPACTP
jgi:hypothetical protein